MLLDSTRRWGGKESLSGSIIEERRRLVHIISHAGGILKERGSDVSGKWQCYCSSSYFFYERGGGGRGSFVPIYSTISYTLGVTIQLWWVGDRQTVLSTVPTQQHGDDDDDLIGGTSIAIIWNLIITSNNNNTRRNHYWKQGLLGWEFCQFLNSNSHTHTKVIGRRRSITTVLVVGTTSDQGQCWLIHWLTN